MIKRRLKAKSECKIKFSPNQRITKKVDFRKQKADFRNGNRHPINA